MTELHNRQTDGCHEVEADDAVQNVIQPKRSLVRYFLTNLLACFSCKASEYVEEVNWDQDGNLVDDLKPIDPAIFEWVYAGEEAAKQQLQVHQYWNLSPAKIVQESHGENDKAEAFDEE